MGSITVTSEHVRNIRYCVSHMRKFCDLYGFPIRRFLHEGAEAEILDGGKLRITCGGVTRIVDDAQILRLVESAAAEE